MGPQDLDPADLEIRIGLRDLLLTRRHQLGWSQAALATVLGMEPSAVAYWEGASSWRMTSVQRWAGCLGGVLLAFPGGEPPERPERPGGTEGWAWDRRQLLADLRSARRAAGVTQRQLAGRIGITDGAVRQLEHGTNVRLCTAQRYVRALGGELWIGVQW